MDVQRVISDVLVHHVLGADQVAGEVVSALRAAGFVIVAPAEAPGFEEFWRTYPRRVARKHAHAAWLTLLASGVSASDVMAGLARWNAYWQREQTPSVFIPHPKTWLNGGYYADAPRARVDESGAAIDRVVERARGLIDDAGAGWLGAAGVDRSVARPALAGGHGVPLDGGVVASPIRDRYALCEAGSADAGVVPVPVDVPYLGPLAHADRDPHGDPASTGGA